MEVHAQSGAQDGCHRMTPVCPVLPLLLCGPPAQLGPLVMASTSLSTASGVHGLALDLEGGLPSVAEAGMWV